MSVLFSYCFLPYKRHFRKFNVLIFHLLRRRQGKLCCPTLPEEKVANLSSTPIAPNLRLSIDRRFSFQKNVNSVPNIQPWPQEQEKFSQKIGTWRFHGTASLRGVLNFFVVLSIFRKARSCFSRVLHTMMRLSWDVTIWNQPCFFCSIFQRIAD